MTGDWIKVHRRMLDHPVMQHDGLCRLWMYCLMRANWKESNWLIPGTTKQIKVPRGGFISGRDALHKTLFPKKKADNPSASTVWRWLLSLEELGCVKVENMNNRCSLVTICKYNTYQDAKEPRWTTDAQLADSRRTTGGQLMHTEEESNNSRREEFSLSLTLPDGEFEFPQRWQIPSLIRALGNWAAHIQAQGKHFQRMHLEALLLHHAQSGWSPEKLERGINLSLSKTAATTIIDPDEQDRPRSTGTGGRPKKDYTP